MELLSQPVEADALQKQIKYYQMVSPASKGCPAGTFPNIGEFADVSRELSIHAHFAFTSHCIDMHSCI